MKDATNFDHACDLVEQLLTGSVRRTLVDRLSDGRDYPRAFKRLRDAMRANAFETGDGRVDLDRLLRRLDATTREEGFHVLHDWDGKAGRVNEDHIAVDVLHFVATQRATTAYDAGVLATLFDYYLMNVLALLSLRVWDHGDADANLDRVDRMLIALQGPDGSGQHYAADAETLILLATAHYEPREHGYDLLLDRTRSLSRAHRLKIAIGHAAAMGNHLRFGFEATYARDTTKMRDDNVADYPWLCFALATVMDEYVRLRSAGVDARGREAVVEAMVNGLTGDARAFVGQAPASLGAHAAERQAFRDAFLAHRDELVEEFEPHRPRDQWYSPLAFFYNFSHNVLKGTVVDALLRGEPWRLTLNDLLTGLPHGGAESVTREQLARTLMGYARLAPDRIRGQLMPVIVYDVQAGRQAFAVAMKKLADA